MTIAIQAKYYGPTNHKGSRYRISAGDHKARFVPFDYGASGHEGIGIETVRDYVRECFPYADADKLTGPHYVKADLYVFTFTD